MKETSSKYVHLQNVALNIVTWNGLVTHYRASTEISFM